MKTLVLFLGLSFLAVSCGTTAPEQEVKVDSVAVEVVDSAAVVEVAVDSAAAVTAVAASEAK